MCFSASASFTASGILALLGYIAIKKQTTPSQKYLVMVPWIFSAQQFIEGTLWLGLQGTLPPWTILPTAYIFLFVAHFIWPLLIPTALIELENDWKRLQILKGILGVGIFTAVMLGIGQALYPLSATMYACHISYALIGAPVAVGHLLLLTYVIATVAPFFASSAPRIWTIGIVLSVSCIVSYIMYYAVFTSVWCFFAALISVTIITVMHYNNAQIGIADYRPQRPKNRQ